MKLSQATDKICSESEVFEKVLSLDNKSILELGCGRADITRLIASNGHGRLVTATEVDEQQHSNNLLIDDLPNVTFMIAGSEAIPLDNNSIDVAFMFKSLHHVPMELMDKALTEIHRVLKPGGMAYISEPVFAGEFNEVLRLFHNEEIVRKAAFNAIRKSVDDNLFLLADEIFFKTRSIFQSFDEFEQRIINVTHTDHRLSPDLYKTVKERFMPHMQDDGAKFQVPIRVDLLQKPAT